MYKNRKVYAIIGAAGSGKRMAAPLPKQFLNIGGKTILETTVDRFRDTEYVDEIVIVTAPDYRQLCCRFFTEDIRSGRLTVIDGGSERQDSIGNAVKYAAGKGGPQDIILIHDGVRPYVTCDVIDRVTEEADRSGGAVAAVPTKDTIRHIDRGTLDRSKLYNVQTPQGFRLSVISDAFDKAAADGFYGTDDGSLVQRAGYPVAIVAGDEKNIKITTPEDLRVETRIGSGYDVHKLVEGRELILGGVNIPFEKGLLGHSDADVLVHAVMDAVLGAAALGDIGKLFPDNDEKYSGADSLKLLGEVGRVVKEAGYYPGNIDGTIVCQRPRMAEYIPAMRENIARVLDMDISRVSIKATTTEKLGFAGRGEGIAAEAVCLLKGQ